MLTILCLGVFAAVALLGTWIGKAPRVERYPQNHAELLRCGNDGTEINPFYQVDAYLNDDTVVSFCSIYCAKQWFKNNTNRVVYVTVVDEVTGERFDASLAHFVKSDTVSVPEVQNRIHAFYRREDALIHAEQYSGKLIENPFGASFVLPQAARFDHLTVGAPELPDAVPLRLAVFRPIFKENHLNVDIVTTGNGLEAEGLLLREAVDGIICDLPTALALSRDCGAKIVKNVLRSNPYRPLFALVGTREKLSRQGRQPGGLRIAVPKGMGFRFYLEYYLSGLDLSLAKVAIQEVQTPAAAWERLTQGSVAAALLRTPFTDVAKSREMTVLADDRNMPWMSVMVLRNSVIESEFAAVERFIYALEQSVLALNLKPDDFRPILEGHGGIPRMEKEQFPMPIFEGANCPAPDEIRPVMNWLVEKNAISAEVSYQDVVDPRFLPDPEDVGLAFCCR